MPADRGKIYFGLAVFVALVALPFWFNAARGKPGRPEVVKPAQERECVEPARFMVAKHMNLLNDWRDWYVRDARERGARSYRTQDGRTFRMSLTSTCLSARCHASKSEFCDRCHDYVGVSPYCFDCHLAPKGGRRAARAGE
jgi:hypothetical protein